MLIFVRTKFLFSGQPFPLSGTSLFSENFSPFFSQIPLEKMHQTAMKKSGSISFQTDCFKSKTATLGKHDR